MSATVRLALPFVAAGQDQPEVTVNTGLNRLDVYVQTSVIDKDLATPPGSPAEGDMYIIAAVATGDWAGREKQIAHLLDGSWTFKEATEGMLAFVEDELALYIFYSATWHIFSTSAVLSADITLPVAGQWVWRDNSGPIILAIFEAGNAGGGRIEYARPLIRKDYGEISG